MCSSDLAASLNHPHIVQAYAVGKYEDIYYFGMEYVEGQTVQELMVKEPVLDEDSVLAIGLNIAEALREAWDRKKMIHRDIKPDNIMLGQNNQAVLIDFGLARPLQINGKKTTISRAGSPSYQVPLKWKPQNYKASDMWSFGILMFEFITGKRPIQEIDFSGDMILSENWQAPLALIPRQIKNSILGCLRGNEDFRLTANNVLKMLNDLPHQ